MRLLDICESGKPRKRKKIREPIGFVSIIVEKFFVLTILSEQDVNKILYI